MIKKMFGAILVLCVLMSAMTVAASEIAIVFDGEELQSDTAPAFAGGQLLVPIRVIAERHGANVSWEAAQRLVTIIKDNRACLITIDSGAIFIFEGENFSGVDSQPSPTIINDRTMVPLNILADCFNLNAWWNEEQQQVVIATD